MNEQAAEAMNSLTIFEARVLHASIGYVCICGNGQMVKCCPENEAEDAEELRTQHGY